MKKTYFLLCLLLGLGISVQMFAQSDPGTANLKHQWTFDDGTAKDVVGTANGTLEGAATIASKALVTSSGGYLSFPAADLGVNSYPEVTAEIWFTPTSAANGGFTMLSYFGNTTGNFGTDYFSISTARGDNVSRTAISCGDTGSPWASEDGVNSTEYDDGKLHHMVATLTATGITFYVDGLNVGTKAYARTQNVINAIGTQFAYLAKGGYTGDPTWKGLIHKFSLYDKALTDDNVLYLFQKGAEEQPVIAASITSLALDNSYPAEVFNVSSSNLSSNITITAPAGITVLPTTVAANEKDVAVTVIYPGTNVIEGNITLTSGTSVVNIPIKTASDLACFTPIYPETLTTNLLGDFKSCTTMANFGGWGTREASTIVTDPANVYCGAGSIKIGNGTSTGSGSLDVAMASILQPNTAYRVKVMIKTIGGTFHLGVDAAPNIEKAIDTNGEWKPLEFTFTTGGVLGANPVMYINNYATTGLLAYVDNYELYLSQDQSITTSTQALSFDPESSKSLKFSVVASNLGSDIVLTAPAGITLSKSTLPSTAAGDTVTVTYDGTTPVSGNILLKSGSVEANVVVKGLTTSNTTCFTPLYNDRPNLVADPYMNDLTDFGGWGTKSIMYNVDSVYCGSRCGAIIGGGSIDIILTNKLMPNTIYKSRAMVRTIGDFQIGVFGQGNAEFTDSINTGGLWKEIVFEFTTGASMGANSGVYFNNYSRNGTRGYIDNWELYKKDTLSAVAAVKDLFENIYVQNGKIVAEFDLDQASVAQLSVFTIQGALVSDERFTALAGTNRKVVNANLPSGMYIVKLTQNGQYSFKKLIK
ncbi:MAG: carbohydrate binding domain-containing protein [Paludibacter sp.]